MIKNTWYAAAVSLLLVACGGDGDYVPGSSTSESCMGVYFDSSNPSEYIFQPGEASEVELTLTRAKSEGGAEVPLVVTADEGLTIPATATFAQGEQNTTIKISFGQLEESRKYKFKIAIPEEYADHYTITEGSTSFSAFIMVASWTTISDQVTMTWSTLGVTNTFTTSIEQLGTYNRYRFRNLVGSGVDYIFTIGSASTAYPGYNSITTYSNCEPYEGSEAKGVYLFDDATQSYPTWTVANGSIEVADICILEDYGTSLGYSCISLEKRSGYVYLYFTDYTDEQYEYYNPIAFSWKK